ncbi:MAG: alpha/beta fold hydrolase [Cyclobacteriaceae bacterium]|nr:alpha/beta fold hydrolase [Cyclobacteriaceae bacterium]
MPLISSSYTTPPYYLFNSHAETIVPSIFRTVEGTYVRERLELVDGDFLDLDWMRRNNKKLVIISHGLEGSSERHYSKGMAKYFYDRGWDAMAWNCRGCSGVMNRLPRFYHHGATEDLAAVVDRAIQLKYEYISLIGFSMGGSMSLKYVGERKGILPTQVKSAITFSVPCNLKSSATELDKPSNWFYLTRFLKKLEKKIRVKSVLFPEQISATGFEKIKTFREFDNRYTAPLHGFSDADDFYIRASSGPYLQSIEIPTLLVNALNDPFLPDACYPLELANKHPHLYLETPARGGHVGFSLPRSSESWMERRAYEFAENLCASLLMHAQSQDLSTK